MSSKLVEISGQCDKCHDLFTVELVPVRRTAEKPNMQYYRPVLSHWLAYREGRFHHKPNKCDGTVRLIGGMRTASFSSSTNNNTNNNNNGSNK